MTIDTVAEDQCFENRKKEFRGLKVANCWILNFQKKILFTSMKLL